jgi:FMN phosphatase YigB (HAD superfamily)
MIKHVSFDCWNTVLRTNPEFTSARSFELSKLFDYPADEMSEIFKRYGSLFDEMEIATGHAVLSNQRIYAVIREIFDRKYTDIFPLNSHINSAMQINDSMVHRHVPILMDPNFPEILLSRSVDIQCLFTE